MTRQSASFSCFILPIDDIIDDISLSRARVSLERGMRSCRTGEIGSSGSGGENRQWEPLGGLRGNFLSVTGRGTNERGTRRDSKREEEESTRRIRAENAPS